MKNIDSVSCYLEEMNICEVFRDFLLPKFSLLFNISVYRRLSMYDQALETVAIRVRGIVGDVGGCLKIFSHLHHHNIFNSSVRIDAVRGVRRSC